MANARRFAQAALLSTGKVLVVGGQNYNATLAGAEVYDPTSNSWSTTGSMSTPRLYFVAAPLLNGKVMAVGGANPSVILSSAELYDPATRRWSATGGMNVGRIYFAATVLGDGRVLAAAGNVGEKSAELYEPRIQSRYFLDVRSMDMNAPIDKCRKRALRPLDFVQSHFFASEPNVGHSTELRKSVMS